MKLPTKQHCRGCATGWATPALVYDSLPKGFRDDGFHFLCPDCFNRRLNDLVEDVYEETVQKLRQVGKRASDV